MRNFFKPLLWSLALTGALTFTSCDPEEEKVEFKLVSLMAGDIDLNGATTASGVPATAVITATFSKSVDASSVAITLTQDYDDAVIEVDTDVSGSTVTITPSGLGSGALYIMGLGAIKSSDGDALAALTRNFSTGGNFVPAGAVAYWPFEDNTNDEVGAFDPSSSGVVGITYASGVSGKGAVFNGTTSIIEVANGDDLMNTPDFSLSFWVNASSTDKTSGHFVMGLGAFYGFQFEIAGDYSNCKLAARYELADATTASEDLWFPGDGKDKDNGGWQGWDFVKDLSASGGVAGLLKDKWAHVVCVYNSTDRQGIMYINGEKMKSFDFDLWPEADVKRGVTGLKYGGAEPDVVNELAFGFIQSRAGTMWDAEPWGGYDQASANHYKGMLDEVRIFHKPLSAQEVELMYDSESAGL